MASRSATFLKKSVPFFYLGGGAFAGLAVMYPHTLGLEYYKDLMAIRTPDGKEEGVDMDTLKLTEEIKRDCGWAKRSLEATEKISFFTSSSLEFCHLGTSKTKWGSYLGIPKYYLMKYMQDEKHLHELFRLLNIDPSSKAANDIWQSFNISEAAKTYALAREMRLCKNYQIFFIAGGVQIAVGCFYLIPNVVSALLPFRGVRLVSFISLLPLLYYSFLNTLKSSSCFIQKGADKAAASLSYQIASGGVEYYDAMILRQNAINSVTTKRIDDKNFLQELVTPSWTDSYMSLEERKEHLTKLVETMYKQESGSSQ